VHIHTVIVAYGIGLQKSADVVCVVSSPVVVEACFRVVSSAGEQVWIAKTAGCVWFAEDIVGVPLNDFFIFI
jgi:hypothetical protein